MRCSALATRANSASWVISCCVGQVVIGLDDAPRVAFQETDDDQDFFVTFLPLVRARDHATLDQLDDERTFRAIAHVDFGPDAFADRSKRLRRVVQRKAVGRVAQSRIVPGVGGCSLGHRPLAF
jgi:hypothetical protein